MFDITVDKFSGPLGLLLKLIEAEELDITEIALAKIANDYLEYIKKAKIDPEQVADFLVIAAKLLYIKSKTLLPYLATAEEDQDIEELEKQLRMYKEFIEASKKIEKLVARKKFLFIRPFIKNYRRRWFLKTPEFHPPKNIGVDDLAEGFKNFLETLRLEEQVLKEELIEHQVSIEERILFIQQNLLERIKFSFKDIIASAQNKTEVIVNFLAVLELAKQRELNFSQQELFGDIEILRIGS
jgi:segregation and condensation protein A